MTDHEDIEDKPVYMISIAAKLTGMHPQTLRIYERKQLLQPGRTPKSTRLYSQNDIGRLKYIQQLTQDEGVNLAGVKIIMELQARLEGVQKTLADMERQIAEAERRISIEMAKATKNFRTELVLIPRGKLARYEPG